MVRRRRSRGRRPAWRTRLTALADAEVTAAVDEMTGYLTALVAEKRRHPGNDVLSTLIAARDEGDRLSQDELISFTLVLLAGGYGTTADRLAGTIHLLLDEPGRYRRLRDTPDAIPKAVEELRATPRRTYKRTCASPRRRSDSAASPSPRGRR
ncbi:hypothetical protein ACFWFI_03525 [Streptomyces sp. NPDC060209]|uniref:hypothetical protein n=1 Tax=Streptomyces sp. NPDC060209 TaxID=3347073 RepID=UPI003656DD85